MLEELLQQRREVGLGLGWEPAPGREANLWAEEQRQEEEPERAWTGGKADEMGPWCLLCFRKNISEKFTMETTSPAPSPCYHSHPRSGHVQLLELFSPPKFTSIFLNQVTSFRYLYMDIIYSIWHYQLKTLAYKALSCLPLLPIPSSYTIEIKPVLILLAKQLNNSQIGLCCFPLN